MAQYNAVLFDMDGTLLDTITDIADALNQTLSDFGYPTHSKNDVKRFIGSGAYQLMERALPDFTDRAEIEKLLADYRRQYEQRICAKTAPFPGVLPMLTALDEAGLTLAIISNKGDTNVKRLAKEHFGKLIRVTVGAKEAVPLKPEPDMLEIALRELKVDPEHTLYIGDAATDFQAAQSAGMDCILVRWGYGDPYTLAQLSPLFFADDPAELPMLILQEEE